MIYVCLPSRNEAETVGLVLWKIRKVFEQLGREYHVLVVDDGSTDDTSAVLDQYSRVVPVTVIKNQSHLGYGRSVEALFRRALEISDRPRRDCAVLMHADYVHRPEHLSDIVRAIESGADVVVGESRMPRHPLRGYRLVRRLGAAWLRSAVEAGPVRDPLSGYFGFRLSTLGHLMAEPPGRLECEGWAINAELLALAAAQARRVETFPMDERHELQSRPSRVTPWAMAQILLRSRGPVKAARARGAVPLPERAAEAPRSGGARRGGRGRGRGRSRGSRRE
jgi:hypothetical protein